MRRFLTLPLLGLGLLLPAPRALAQVVLPPGRVPGTAMTTGPQTDYKDFLFLASDRPVLLRLHLRIDGRPYHAPWDEYVKKFFAYCDRDNNGSLSPKELENVPNGQFLQFHLQGAIGFPFQGQTAPMQQMDSNKDGKVSLQEFKDYYSRSGLSSLRFNSGSNQGQTNAVNDAIFKHLDANKDGKLTQEELTKASNVFQRLDLDDDEMIALSELAPNSNVGYYPPVQFADARARRGAANEPGLMEINPGQPAGGMAQQILSRYDRDKDGRLTRAESGLDEATFKALDANKDGKLDANELAGFFRRDADLELAGHLGKLPGKTEGRAAGLLRSIGQKVGVTGPGGPARAEVFNPTNRPMALAGAARRVNGDTLALTFGDAGIEVAVNGGVRSARDFGQFYLQQFKTADAAKKGVIDRKQAMTTNFLDQIFPLADHDGDGKLTEKELTAYLAMQGEGAGCFAALSIQDHGRSLFDLFDTDHDGRLSVRELRTAWSRLAPLAKGGALARSDVPRRIQVALGQGQAGFRAGPVFSAPGMAAAPRRQGKPAPLWFQRMDRNNDGDLSPREFLGTEEDFRKLDADGDGLISAAEARQADARLAREPGKKP